MPPSSLLPSHCPLFHTKRHLRGFTHVCRDWLFEVPLDLLAELVHEGMAEQWRCLSFDATPTGGALAWLPSGHGVEPPHSGCLVYPAGEAMNQLCILCSGGLWVREGMARSLELQWAYAWHVKGPSTSNERPSGGS